MNRMRLIQVVLWVLAVLMVTACVSATPTPTKVARTYSPIGQIGVWNIVIESATYSETTSTVKLRIKNTTSSPIKWEKGSGGLEQVYIVLKDGSGDIFYPSRYGYTWYAGQLFQANEVKRGSVRFGVSEFSRDFELCLADSSTSASVVWCRQ